MKTWIFTYGSLRMGFQSNCKIGLLSLLIFGSISAANVAEEETEDEVEVPSLEFLEFLGSFETDEGEWIDPESLMSEEFTELLQAAPIIVPNENANDNQNNGNRQIRRQ